MTRATSFILLVLSMAGAFLAGAVVSQRGGLAAAANAAGETVRYACPMHPQFTADRRGDCPVCGMTLVANAGRPAPGENARLARSAMPGTVSLTSDDRQRVGIRAIAVERTAGRRSLRMVGRVAAEETRTYDINAGSDGFIRDVSAVTTGSQVRKGQRLATFVAPSAIFEIQGFIVTLNAQDRLKQSGVDETGQVNPNSSVFENRLQKLQDLGMSELQIDEIRRTREVPKSITILAPADGIVLTRSVTAGQKFQRGADWFRIADLSRVWILADLTGLDADQVRPGLHAVVKSLDRGRRFDAIVTDVLPQFDPAARTLRVRLEVDNPAYVLRPDMFVDVEMQVALAPAISVPVDAVIDSGLRKTVFVERREGVFEPRQVRTGWRFDGRVEIVEGLAPGERIAAAGTFLLDSESRMTMASAGGADASGQDPICGMAVDPRQASAAGRTTQYHGRIYVFCSMGCKHQFDQAPVQ
ncbi:MAG: efflux RND transporter periplasmic adaptor subunit [Acidobacteriota bacterium]